MVKHKCRNCGAEIEPNSVGSWDHIVNPYIYTVDRLLMCDNVRAGKDIDYTKLLLTDDEAEPLTESENITEILNNYCE